MFGFIPFAKTSKSILPAVQYALSLFNREGFKPLALGRQLLFACTLFSLIILAACPALSQQPTSLDFGSVTIGQFKDQVLTKTVYTEGVYAVFLFPPTIIGPDASDFQITVDGYAPDGYAGSYFQDTAVSVTIRFTPSKAGPEQATLVGNGYTILPYSTFDYTPVTLTGNGVAAPPATISSFTLSPSQINAAGLTVTADVGTVGSFSKVTVSPAPGSLNIAPPTYDLANNGAHWTAEFTTSFLEYAKVNPITFVATGTRSDGSTVTALATLQVGQTTPSLSLTLLPDQSPVKNNGVITFHGTVTNPSTVSALSTALVVTLPSNITYLAGSAVGLTYNAGANTLTWTGSLPVSPNSAPVIYPFSFSVLANSDVPSGSQLTFTATASCSGFQSAIQSSSITVGDSLIPDSVDVHFDPSDLLEGKADVDLQAGTPPLLAKVEPDPKVYDALQGNHRPKLWLGVTEIDPTNGTTYRIDSSNQSGVTVGGELAALGLISPSVSPVYIAQFPQVNSSLKLHVGFTADSLDCTILDDILSFVSPVNVDDVLKYINIFRNVSALPEAYTDLTATKNTGNTGIAKASHDLTFGMTLTDIGILQSILSSEFGKSFTISEVRTLISSALPPIALVQQFADLVNINRHAQQFPPDLQVSFVANQSKK